jgi:hypothetical protein
MATAERKPPQPGMRLVNYGGEGNYLPGLKDFLRKPNGVEAVELIVGDSRLRRKWRQEVEKYPSAFELLQTKARDCGFFGVLPGRERLFSVAMIDDNILRESGINLPDMVKKELITEDGGRHFTRARYVRVEPEMLKKIDFMLGVDSKFTGKCVDALMRHEREHAFGGGKVVNTGTNSLRETYKRDFYAIEGGAQEGAVANLSKMGRISYLAHIEAFGILMGKSISYHMAMMGVTEMEQSPSEMIRRKASEMRAKGEGGIPIAHPPTHLREEYIAGEYRKTVLRAIPERDIPLYVAATNTLIDKYLQKAREKKQ